MASTPQWAAERPTTPQRAEELIRRSFPALRGLPVEPLAEGWDNSVYVVGGTWVFRFPRRRVALPGFARELAVLPRVAGLLPLAVPVPELVAEDDDPADPWPFAGARLLRGRELADADLPEDARVGAAASIGGFLRVLHRPRTGASLDVDLPHDPMNRGWPGARASDIREQLRRLVADRTWPGDRRVDRLLDEAAELGAPSGEPVLVHGDLHVRHLLLDDAGRAAGVIDWGDVCRADPSVDLALAYAAFTGPARTAFLQAYGEVGAEREMRARALGVRLSVLLARYAADDHRPTLLGEALAGLRRVVE